MVKGYVSFKCLLYKLTFSFGFGFICLLIIVVILVSIEVVITAVVFLIGFIFLFGLHLIPEVSDFELFNNIITLLILVTLLRWRYVLLFHFWFWLRLRVFSSTCSVIFTFVIRHLCPVFLFSSWVLLLFFIFTFAIHFLSNCF